MLQIEGGKKYGYSPQVQCSHSTKNHAIIPTRIKADFENLNEVEKNLYLMVSRAYLAQFYPIHEYKSTKVIISYADEKFAGKGHRISTSASE